MADARRVGHIGEFYNINPNVTPEGRVANLSTLIISLFAFAFSFSG